MNVVSEIVNPSLLREHAPELEKVYIELRPVNGAIDVALRVPLDATIEAEAKVRRYMDRTSLVVRYRVPSAAVNLKMEVEALRSTFDAIYRQAHESAGSADSLAELKREEQQEMLCPLAALGASLYERLFREMEPEEYPVDSQASVREAALSALSRSQAIVVRSAAEDLRPGSFVPLFPWPLLYDDPDFVRTNRSTLDPRRFWGFRHELQHDLPWIAQARFLPQSPTLLAAICPATDRRRHGDVFGTQIQVRIAENVLDFSRTLADFKDDALYFFGHGGHEGPPVPANSYLMINDVKLYVSDLRPPRFHNDVVLLFLNSCRSAPANAVDQNTMAGFLGTKGDRKVCCVATVASVPESVGVQFARVFWPRFLAGARLGAALREARLSLLDAGSPLGLLYDLYGRVDTQILGARSQA